MNMRRWMSCLLIAAFSALLCGCNQQTDEISGQSNASSESTQSGVSDETSSEEAASDTSSSDETENSAQPLMSLEEYPTVDGSTAAMPLMAAVLQKACGIDAEQAESYVYASKTSQSWIALSNGDADLLLVYEAPESTKEQLAQGPKLEVTAIGRDALVFIVNEQNPVESLTQDQLRDIYTGTVTNWAELGGNDQSIVAFQRDETSGSQTLFEKLLVGDRELTLTDPPTELRPGMMGALVDGLASYNNEGNAIGYSVYYYISEMYAQPGLKLIGVDGVQPEYDTIADSSYPLCNEFYVAIRADEPEDSPTRQLYNWICSEEGKQTLIDAGYVPAE
ncbi:MAG TPA: substrate-binding domain-containing protein [Candidatus Faecivivens stercorigallinarum]|nr:substrate-binding domain-containing protein [Candidatus Faecivivens stercorigallinarum]